MPFTAGREPNTSICTGCYLTVSPDPGQSLTEAEFKHACNFPLPTTKEEIGRGSTAKQLSALRAK